MATKGKATYDKSDISSLEDLEAVRKRPGLFIPSGVETSAGLHHLVKEIVDNSIDEASAGYATKIDVILHDDGSVECRDDGRGIPVGIGDDGTETLIKLFTSQFSSGKYSQDEDSAYFSSSGLNGLGQKIVNALSSKLHVKVSREGKEHIVGWENQIFGYWDDSFKKFTPSKKPVLKVGKKTKATGTIVRFYPDFDIFEKGIEVEPAFIRHHLSMMSYLVPGTKFTFKEGKKKEEVFLSKKGLLELVDEKSEKGAITDNIVFSGVHEYTEKVPDANGKLTEMDRICDVEVILRWTPRDETDIYSFVNTIHTLEGGSHEAGAFRAINRVLNKHVQSVKGYSTLEKKHKENTKITNEDHGGLVATIKVKMPEPKFAAQDKHSLASSAAQTAVYNVVARGLDDWLNGKGSKKLHVTNLKKRIYENLRIRLEANAKKETLKKASGLSNEKMPSKLADCRQHGLESGSEMFIVEGDSAAGSLILNRNPDNQAILPLKGKPLNVHGAQLGKALGNSEVKDIIKAMGGGVGQNFDLESCRLSRVVIASDADDDGYHISLLLFTLFWRFFRPFVEDGRLFVAKAPLFTAQLAKGERVFAINEKERDKLNKKYKNPQWTRVKGLGEQDADSLTATVLDHETRNLIQVNVEDAELITSQLDLFMGNSAEARRNFMFDDMENLVEDLDDEVVHDMVEA